MRAEIGEVEFTRGEEILYVAADIDISGREDEDTSRDLSEMTVERVTDSAYKVKYPLCNVDIESFEVQNNGSSRDDRVGDLLSILH